ncbi:MAG: type II methionyl aminopeptidase [Promethearchaeota archaeon]
MAKKTSKKENPEKSTKKTIKKKTEKKTDTTIEEENSKKEDTKLSEEEQKKKEEEERKKKEEEERINSYKQAGEMAKKLKVFIKPKIKVGEKVIDIITIAEDKILELGGKPGFPVNISINHVAAHYTSPPGDKTVIKNGDIVKFDFGIHIDGFSIDTAFTISFNDDPEFKNLTKATEEAVEVAIKMMKPGVKTNELGAEIEKIVKKFKFKPVANLTGHNVMRWDIHSGKSIPCISTPTGDLIEKGEVFAVEVFATNGEGHVHNRNDSYIFSLNPSVKRIQLRRKSAKKVLAYVLSEFKTLPFSKLQIYKEFGAKALFGLNELTNSGKIIEYNVLSEKKGFYVAQTEETVLITKDGYEILT